MIENEDGSCIAAPHARVLLARVYAPGNFTSVPKIELCRSIARNVDVHDEVLPKVPKVGEEFFVDLTKYICLRVEDLFEIPEFEAVVFVAKSS